MFNRLALRILLIENRRLRRDLIRKEKTISELLDKFVHQRRPQRFLQNESQSSFQPNPSSPPTMDYPSDSYSVMIAEAEREVDARLQGNLEPDLTTENDA
jgi:hypothetical protein